MRPRPVTPAGDGSTAIADQPRLASDAVRYYTAAGLTTVVAAAGGLGVPAVWALGVTTVQLAVSIYFGAWILFCLLYAILTWNVFRSARAADLCAWLQESPATRERRRRTEWLAGSGGPAGAVSLCLVAIAMVVSTAMLPGLRSSPVVLILAGLVVVTSWLMIVMVYALHYAREYTNLGGLEFQSVADDDPAFADYCYVAVQVSTGFSTADVRVTTMAMRRTVTAHTLIAFLFNTVLIALLVSLLVSA